jgi:D-ornithine 4,5-aminomutase subunit alpha
MKERKDNYATRKKHLESMSDSELKLYFFELAEKMVDPLVDLGKKYTSKSIERSVLLRMGFSSIESKTIVDILNEYNLLRKGAGHCIYKVSKEKQIDIRDAGNQIAEGKHLDYLMEVFDSNG